MWWQIMIWILCVIGWIVVIIKIRSVHSVQQHSLAKVEALVSSLGEGIVVTDKNGNVELINPAAEKLIGWSIAEAVGKKWYDLAPLEDAGGKRIPPEDRATQKVLSSGQPRSNALYYYVRRDGSRFAVGTTAAPVRLKGETIGVIAVFRDITHEREVDQAKSEFVSLASHQLRTPLSAIKWFSEMLMAGDAGQMTSEQLEFIKNIDMSNERMIELVNSLLNISRIESGRIIIDPALTDMESLIKRVITDMQVRYHDKKVEISFEFQKAMPQVMLDQKLISQVYTNLLTNAYKYTPENGKISVSVNIQGNEIVSMIKDTGYGIPKSDQHRVFEKFFRGSNVIKVVTDGTGLGLYLVKTIIESSHGRIWFESADGQGTTFWFTLPLDGMQAKSGEVELTPD
jgi:PAS domain S-box-containing protein